MTAPLNYRRKWLGLNLALAIIIVALSAWLRRLH